MYTRLLNRRNDQGDCKEPTDWLKPPMIVGYMTLLLHIAGYVWFMATLNVRVTIVEKRLDDQGKIISSLDTTFVPRQEHKERDIERTKAEEVRDHRLDRIEGKIDAVVEALALRH